MAQQDTFQRAKERYDDAREAWRENYDRMREDVRFSNPAQPQQWHPKTLQDREGRVTLTLDQTNQFHQQVTNDARQNTPSLIVKPGDYLADQRVALELAKRVRYIERKSRAAIAYDTAIDCSARSGLGWLRVVPVVIDAKLNWQEPRIVMVHDPMACCIDGDSVEYDGSDAVDGFVEATLSEAAFKRKYPKARLSSFGESNGWFSQQGVRVAEWFHVEVKRGNRIITGDPDTGDNRVAMTEDEYWRVAQSTGVKPHVIETDPQAELGRRVMWRKMSGCEILEETEFPSKWIGLIPVYGQVVWDDGKRYVSGLTRRLMDGQRLHNYAMSSIAEHLLEQPKAPFTASARAIKGYEEHWGSLNTGNPAYLPYNDVPDNESDPPIAPPVRLGPPQFPAAFGTLAQMGVAEMQASVGMFKSVLGQQSNAVSGRAKMADKVEGDTATFHYVDNQHRSLEHMGRVILDMDARLNDTRRTVGTLTVDGKPGTIEVNPELDEAVTIDARGKPLAINPTRGQYDVEVKAGASYTTVREELKERLTQLGQANPALAAALTPILVKLDDLPEADKVMRVCLALLPPNVQQAYNDGEDEQQAIPPAAQAQITAMQGKLEQAGQLLQQLAGQLQEAQQAAGDNALKARELDIKEREVDIKAQEAEADMLRAETEAATAAAAAPTADLAAQVQMLVGAIDELAQGQQAALGEVATVAAAQEQTQDQITQLATLVVQPRVARVEYDEQGRPVAAVGMLQTESES